MWRRPLLLGIDQLLSFSPHVKKFTAYHSFFVFCKKLSYNIIFIYYLAIFSKTKPVMTDFGVIPTSTGTKRSLPSDSRWSYFQECIQCFWIHWSYSWLSLRIKKEIFGVTWPTYWRIKLHCWWYCQMLGIEINSGLIYETERFWGKRREIISGIYPASLDHCFHFQNLI